MASERQQKIANYTLTFQKFELPNREAMMRGEGPMIAEAVIAVVAPDGTTTTVRPALRVEADKPPVSEPVALPGGATAALTQVDAANGIAIVQIGGVDLSTISPDELKARAFLEVSREPGIKLVWAGFIVGVLGGLLALLRRWREARPSTGIASAPAPARRRDRPVMQPEPAIAQIVPNAEVQ
jgi:hypothetical protein